MPNKLQQLVIKHYCGGEYAYCKPLEEAFAAGDPLFHFVLGEACDAEGTLEYLGMLTLAINDLRSLRAEVDSAYTKSALG